MVLLSSASAQGPERGVSLRLRAISFYGLCVLLLVTVASHKEDVHCTGVARLIVGRVSFVGK